MKRLGNLYDKIISLDNLALRTNAPARANYVLTA